MQEFRPCAAARPEHPIVVLRPRLESDEPAGGFSSWLWVCTPDPCCGSSPATGANVSFDEQRAARCRNSTDGPMWSSCPWEDQTMTRPSGRDGFEPGDQVDPYACPPGTTPAITTQLPVVLQLRPVRRGRRAPARDGAGLGLRSRVSSAGGHVVQAIRASSVRSSCSRNQHGWPSGRVDPIRSVREPEK